MKLEEVYRFQNGMKEIEGRKIWDTNLLFQEIKTGLKRCGEVGKIPCSMSVDTWGVDYVLLDEKDQILGACYGYRDNRTDDMDQEVYQKISEEALYKRTGIQKQMFNTIYQLMAVKKMTPEYMERAKTFLMLPDYFHYLLTGEKKSEYTDATSTQIVNPRTKQWDKDLICMLGYPYEMFCPLQMPGTLVGDLTESIQEQVGFNTEVVLCASHDTASAVMAVPEPKGSELYISSGTWSLMGTELKEPLCDENSRLGNFTNEGGYNYRFRYLKNIMGLWMIQSVKRELSDKYSFADLCQLAEENEDFPSGINVDDKCFMAPKSMIEAIQEYCRRTGQAVPKKVGEIAVVIYKSMAQCYAKTAQEIEKNTGKEYKSLYIIGGGSNAEFLNKLTAEMTGKTVCAGPSEATAIGNIISQMIRAGEFSDLQEARKCVRDSFDVKKIENWE